MHNSSDQAGARGVKSAGAALGIASLLGLGASAATATAAATAAALVSHNTPQAARSLCNPEKGAEDLASAAHFAELQSVIPICP